MAVSESSMALGRFNLTFLSLGLSLWNLAHLLIMFMATTDCLTWRSRASVSNVIRQPRSLGGRRPVDRAAGAALRLIDLTHGRLYSRASHDDFFSAFFDPAKGRRLDFACFPFFFDHFDWQKLFSNNKRPCKRSSRLNGGLLVSEFFQREKQPYWTANGVDRTVSVEQTERASSRKAWIEREGYIPCPAHATGLWQTFKPQLSVQSRTSKPDYTWTAMSTAWEILRTRCKQSSICFSKDEALRKIK